VDRAKRLQYTMSRIFPLLKTRAVGPFALGAQEEEDSEDEEDSGEEEDSEDEEDSGEEEYSEDGAWDSEGEAESAWGQWEEAGNCSVSEEAAML
jgi:hypothetical protein